MRYTQLDALRGLAALTVVMSHFIGFLPTQPHFILAVANTPLHIFWDGAAAVDLFFVLSGFCIAIPYVRAADRRKMKYGSFIIRRFFRLYPAYVVTIFFCLWLKNTYDCPGENYISLWGGEFYQWDKLSLLQLVNVLSLIGSFNPDWLDPPTWSLIIEMRMAFILPFLILIVLEYTKKPSAMFAWFLIFSFIEFLSKGRIRFINLFFLGIVLAYYLPTLWKHINNLSKTFFCFYLICGIILYESRFPFRLLLSGNEKFALVTGDLLFHVITGLGSAIIIMCFFRESVNLKLSNSVGSFLGYISYSIYLIHFPMLLFLCQLKINLYYIFPFFMFFSVIMAYIMYRFIELPGIKLGRYLSDKV